MYVCLLVFFLVIFEIVICYKSKHKNIIIIFVNETLIL